MIEVELPDGTIAEFPDGTPDTTIKSVLQKQLPSKLQSAGRGALDALGLGYDDEIYAGVKTGFGYTGDYSAEQKRLEASKNLARETNPWSFGGGQVAGAIPSFFIPGGAVARGASLASKAGRGAAAGATLGGVYGSGDAGQGSRLAGAAEGAVIGGAIGGALPVAASGIAKGYGAASRALTSNRTAAGVGAKPETLRMLGNTLNADGTRGAVGARNMARAGNEAMLADAGPNARAILDTSIQRGGPGAVAASRAIKERVTRDSQKFGSALDDILGPREGVTAARTAIRKGSEAVRKKTYDAAYNSPIDYSKPAAMKMEATIKNRVTPGVIEEANRLMRLRGETSQQINAIIGNDGQVVRFEVLPDVRQIDYITRALNQLAESGDGAGALGGQTALGSAYQQLSREIRSDLRELVPNYALALDTAADPIERSQAVKFGAKLLSPSMARDQVDEIVAGMSRAEKTAAAQGIRSQLDDMMANVTRAVQDSDVDAREAIKGIKTLSSRANREKVAAVIGRDKANRLFNEVNRITASFELRASVAENSKTYVRLATDRRIKNMTEPGPLGLAAQGKAIQAPQRALQAVTGQTPEDLVARQDAIYSELSRILTQPGAQSRKVFDAIDQILFDDAAIRSTGQKIERGLGGPHLAYPLTAQSRENLPPKLRLTK